MGQNAEIPAITLVSVTSVAITSLTQKYIDIPLNCGLRRLIAYSESISSSNQSQR
jgi:hypothetical protein